MYGDILGAGAMDSASPFGVSKVGEGSGFESQVGRLLFNVLEGRCFPSGR